MQVDSGWFWLVLIDADWFWFDTDWFWMVLLWQSLQYVQTLLSTRGPRICFNDQHSKMLWHQAAFEQAYKASKMCPPIKLGRPLSITFTPSDLLTGVSFPKCHQCQCKSENTVCVWSFLGNSCRRRITLSLAVARSPPYNFDTLTPSSIGSADDRSLSSFSNQSFPTHCHQIISSLWQSTVCSNDEAKLFIDK